MKACGGCGLLKKGTRLSHSRSACQWMRPMTPSVISGMPKKAARTLRGVSGSQLRR